MPKIRTLACVLIVFSQLIVQIDLSLTYEDIESELDGYDAFGNRDTLLNSKASNGTAINTQMINEELMANTWNYMAELVLILLLAVLSIPANCFLFLFYTKKSYNYKRVKEPSESIRSNPITNSFNTYMIEICLFDTLIGMIWKLLIDFNVSKISFFSFFGILVVYLVSNTLFQFFFYLKKTEYESVFDISNFACKFFIYILRISGAMSNYLVLLLSLNRCMLLHYK